MFDAVHFFPTKNYRYIKTDASRKFFLQFIVKNLIYGVASVAFCVLMSHTQWVVAEIPFCCSIMSAITFDG